MSLALCCNVYNDVHALRGLLESGSRFFDNIFVIHSGPGGARSTDGTIELLEKFGIAPVFDDISKGYGVIRTRLIHECGCDWAMIMDADERFIPQINVMTCEGNDKWTGPGDPNLPKDLVVTVRPEVIDQGGTIKNLIKNPANMAIQATRRHWMDFTMRRPTMNWMKERDHQLRIIRNVPEIGYATAKVMHERLVFLNSGKDPDYIAQNDMGGPFYEHFHMHFRNAYPGSKEWNEQNYDRLSKGEKMLTR